MLKVVRFDGNCGRVVEVVFVVRRIHVLLLFLDLGGMERPQGGADGVGTCYYCGRYGLEPRRSRHPQLQMLVVSKGRCGQRFFCGWFLQCGTRTGTLKVMEELRLSRSGLCRKSTMWFM